MNRSNHVILFFLLASALFSCRLENSSPQKADTGFQYTLYTFDRSSEGCETDSTRCARFMASYPLLKRENADEKVVPRINETLQTKAAQSLGIMDPDGQPVQAPLDELCRQFFAEYNQFSRESSGLAMPWTVETEGRIIHQSDDILTVAIESYQFTGGAHPNSYTLLLNFDCETGALLQWEDILADSLRFLTLAEKSFRTTRDLDSIADLENAGFFWGNAFQLPANFALKQDGLLLFYNTYEVAPYVMGPTEYVLSYDQLSGILKPRFIAQ